MEGLFVIEIIHRQHSSQAAQGDCVKVPHGECCVSVPFKVEIKKKKGLYFLLYFFIAVGLRAIDFFVSGFNCLQLIIRIFCNTGNGLLPGNNLECTVSALVLF